MLGAHAFPGTLEDDLIAVCVRHGVPVRRLARGDRFEVGGAAVEVLNPPREAPAGMAENELSLVLRVSWPGFSALLTGDIESWGEAQVAGLDPGAQVLKVPHHGSGTSSSPSFIDAVQPEVAIVSVAPRGRSSVLRPEVVARYRERGIRVLRTDLVGGVRIRPGRKGLEVEAARVERGYVMRKEFTTDEER